jgi:hypothetical protein
MTPFTLLMAGAAVGAGAESSMIEQLIENKNEWQRAAVTRKLRPTLLTREKNLQNQLGMAFRALSAFGRTPSTFVQRAIGML